MKRTAIIFLTALLFTIPSLYGQDMGPGDRGRGMGPHHYRHHHRGRLWGNPDALKYRFNLSDSQISKIKAINKRFHQMHVTKSDQIYYLRRTLRSIILAPKIDKAKLKAVLKKIGSIEADMRYYRIMHRYEIENVLTPKQKRMVREERMRHRRNFRGPRDRRRCD